MQLVTCGSQSASSCTNLVASGPVRRTGIPCDFAHARISAVLAESAPGNLTVVPPARLCNGTVPRVRASCSLSSSGAGPRSAPAQLEGLGPTAARGSLVLGAEGGRHATQANESGTMKSSATTAGQLRTTAATIRRPTTEHEREYSDADPTLACGSLPRDPPKSFCSRVSGGLGPMSVPALRSGAATALQSEPSVARGEHCWVAARSVPLPAPPRAGAVLREWDHIRVGCGFQHVADHGDAVPAEQRIKAVPAVILRERHDGCSDLAAACSPARALAAPVRKRSGSTSNPGWATRCRLVGVAQNPLVDLEGGVVRRGVMSQQPFL